MTFPGRLFACLALQILLGVVPAKAVERWDVFELALDGPADGNPFVEVQISARFTQGDQIGRAHV